MSGTTYIIRKLRRELEAAQNRKGMTVGLPKVTVDCADLEYALRNLEILHELQGGTDPGPRNQDQESV